MNGIICVLKDYPELLQKYLPNLLKLPFERLNLATKRSERKQAFNDLFTMIMSIPEGKGDGSE